MEKPWNSRRCGCIFWLKGFIWPDEAQTGFVFYYLLKRKIFRFGIKQIKRRQLGRSVVSFSIPFFFWHHKKQKSPGNKANVAHMAVRLSLISFFPYLLPVHVQHSVGSRHSARFTIEFLVFFPFSGHGELHGAPVHWWHACKCLIPETIFSPYMKKQMTPC